MRNLNRTIHTLASLSLTALLAGACGAGSSPSPEPVRADGGSSVPVYGDAWVDPDPDPYPPPPVDAAVPLPDQQPATAQCPDLVGSWKGTIEGKANTYLQNVQMTGEVKMTVTAGSNPGEFVLASLDVQAWSPLLPMFKVPLKTIGAHPFQCDTLNVAAPIEAQGKKGSGTITGKCTATQCTGAFKGTTDDGTMDAQGNFTITKQ